MNDLLKNKNLLVIPDRYNNFVKDPVNIISSYFNQVFVLVRHNPITEISNVLPINYLKPFRKKTLINLSGKPENVTVTLTSLWYAPTDSQYKRLGDKHFKSVNTTIKKKKIEFDLIHSHFTWSMGYVGARLKEKYNVPCIVTAHGYDIYDLPFRDEKWRERIEYVLNSANCVITVSNSNLECIKKLDVKTPVKVIPNGFRPDLFYPKNSEECKKILELPSDKKAILTVGNLVEIKGHKYLIEAMNEVVKHRKDVLCIIVGSGKLKNKLEKQIKKLKLEDHVRLVGGKTHDEIPIWMNAADLFVLPSLNEGNPTVMFECLGCGKPFIGTKVGGEPEIITSEDYGSLTEPADPEEFAEKILIGLDREWDYEKISEYAKQFTWENVAKNILEVYKTVLNRRQLDG